MIQAATIPSGPIAGPAQHTAEWLSVHRTHLTASRMPAVLGVSEYDTAFGVYSEMTGQRPAFEGNEHTRRGTRYEPAIIADYAEQRGVEVIYPMPLYFDGQMPDILAASPDAGIVGLNEGAEAKLTMSRTRAYELGDDGTDAAPNDWIVQATTQMGVMGWDRVDLAVLLYGRLRVYPIHRDAELVRIIRDAAAEFMARVREKRPPEPDWAHGSTLALLKAMHAVADASRVDLAADVEIAWDRYQEIGQQIRDLEKAKAAEQSRVLHAMGDAGMGVTPGGRVLERKIIERAAYECKATSYVRLTEVKTKRRK